MVRWNWGLLVAAAASLPIGCSGSEAGTQEPARRDADAGDAGVADDACSALPACDGDVVGTWQFDGMCPSDHEVASEFTPPDCLLAIVRDVLHGTLTIATDGTFTLDYTQDQFVTNIWLPKCAENTKESCKAREAPLLKFYPEASCTLTGAHCTCVMTAKSTTKTDPAPYAPGSLCAHGDALRLTERVPNWGPGNAPAPDRVIVHALHRVP